MDENGKRAQLLKEGKLPAGLAAQKPGGGYAQVVRERKEFGILPGRHEAFVQSYMRCFSVVDAYVAAGYKGKHSRTNAYRLFNKSEIQARIKELMQDRAKEQEVTLEKVRDSLARIAEMAESEGRYAAAIRSLELLGKYLGMFVEKREIDITISRNEQELDEEIERLSQLVNTEGANDD